MTTDGQKYIDDVRTGKLLSCKHVKNAVSRHLADLDRGDEFPYYYDEHAADVAIDFIKMLRHTKGEWGGNPFSLLPSQHFILCVIFGWRRKSDDLRRFRKTYIEMARKNGKSELAAAILLYCLIMDGEEGAECYSAATTKDQAKIVFKAAKKMAQYLKKDSPQLNAAIENMTHSVMYKPTGGFCQAVASDADTLDGLNPHCVIIDEYHAHSARMEKDVLGVMATGMGGRAQPLMIVITTAGFNQSSPCYTEERKVAVDVLAGDMEEDTLFAIIYTIDEEDEEHWDDPAVWTKPNPHLGRTPRMDFMEAALKEAKNKGQRYITQFLTKNLNLWTDAPEVWISGDTWRQCMGDIDLETLKGRECMGGLDLASVSDLCSLCLFFPWAGPDDRHVVLWWSWVPEGTIPKRSGKVNYPLWVSDKWITATPGNSIEFAWIKKDILALAELYDIQLIHFDRHLSYDIIPQLVDEGLEMLPFGQGFVSMSTPSKYWEALLGDTKCLLGTNPVAKWANGNVVIDMNPAGDIKPNKDKSHEKIDHIVAAIMAVGGFLYVENERGQGTYLAEDDTELIIV